MGYTLKIGELETNIIKEGLDSYISNNVVELQLENAPAFGEPTDFTNSRWPSYTSWIDAMEFVGLEDLFFNEDTGLMRDHPGCVPLVIEHKEIIDSAYKEFYDKHPNAKAGFSPKTKDKPFSEDKDWPLQNMYAVRLEWLKFWVDWSLNNCKNPVFYNS